MSSTSIIEKCINEPSNAIIRCAICFDECPNAQISSVCCIDKYCKSCFNQYVRTIVYSTFYTIPTIKCCLCLKRICSRKWMIDLIDPFEYILKFELNAKSLLKIRCCYADQAIFAILKNDVYPIQKTVLDVFVLSYSEFTSHVPEIVGYLPIRRIEQIIISWIQLLNDEISCSDFVNYISLFMTKIVNTNIKGYFSFEYIEDFNQRIENLVLPKYLRNLFIKIIELIYPIDIELYYKLQVSLLNKYPMIWTPCCQEPLCYSCNISNHHNDKTCEEYRSVELMVGGIQLCPDCHVSTVRTEGCVQMNCVCGKRWNWNESLEVKEINELKLITKEVTMTRPFLTNNNPYPFTNYHTKISKYEKELVIQNIKNLIDKYITQLQMK